VRFNSSGRIGKKYQRNPPTSAVHGEAVVEPTVDDVKVARNLLAIGILV
jgi:hypothetical protein